MSVRASHRWLLIFLSVACSIPLVIVAFGSLHSRYIADDYCWIINAQADPLAFIGDMYQRITGRFTGILLVAVVAQLGISAATLIVAGTLVLGLAAGYFLIAATYRYFATPNQDFRLWAILGALLITTSTLVSLPSLHQSLYWYTVMLMYSLPIVIFTIYLWLVWRFPEKSWSRFISLGLVFFSVGGSETFAAVQIGLVALFLAIAWQSNKRTILLLGLIGTLIGFSIMLIAPGNNVRSGDLASQPSLAFIIGMLPSVPLYPFAYAMLQAPLVVLAAFTLTAIFAYYFGVNLSKKLYLVAVLFVVFGSVAIAFLPSLYVLSRLPASRAWTTPIWITLCGVMAFGYFYGLIIRKGKPPLGYLPRHMQIVIAVLAVGFLMNGATVALDAFNRQAAYAAAWDARDAYLKTQAGSTETIRARSFHGTFDLEDLTGDPNYWTNACIARYYNLPAILPDDQPPFVP